MSKLLVATRNPAKLREYKDILANFSLQILALEDLGIEQDVAETASTIAENALLKANSYVLLSGLPTLADDSGLEIDALNGWPGVHSRRVWGEAQREATDEEALAEVMRRMHDIPQERRGACFVVVSVLALPTGERYTGTATTLGSIAMEPRGIPAIGFPYRRLFIPQGSTKTHGELTPKDKATGYLNHRKKAILELEPYFKMLERL